MTQAQVDAWVSAMPMAALFIDSEKRISCINEMAITVLGQSLNGRNYTTALRQPSVLDSVETCFQQKTAQSTQFIIQDDQNETVFDLRCAYVADLFQGVLVTLTDVSEAQKTTQLHRDFVANVSHELRTPLTALTGFIETLQGPAKSDEKASQRFLGIMASETARMNRLVEDLLSLSRVEAQERQRPTERVDIVELIESVVSTFDALNDESALQVSHHLPDERAHVLGDTDQLRQVLTNLIENAFKYGGQGVKVCVHAEEVDFDTRLRTKCVRIAVSDTGIGFEPVHIARLTERFYRIDGHRSREMGGTGLGLAIVKHIISRHRGRLEISSVVSQGSEFTVILPSLHD